MSTSYAAAHWQISPTRWLLDQPAKLAAERVIRATRERSYFEKWDAFTAGVGEALDVRPELTPFLGATVGAGLDLLFDQHVDAGEARCSPGPSPREPSPNKPSPSDSGPSEPSLSRPSPNKPRRREPDLGFLGYRLRQYCAPEKAFGWHASQGSDGADASLRNAGEETVALYEGVAAALALITLGGLRGDLDGRWLPFWQAWVRRTLRAQVASCGLDTTLVPEKRSDDGCTLAPYLELAAATDMAAMSIAGLLGFSDRQRELIDPVRAVLPALSSLIRLAADMAFDPVEPVNCAIYLCAAETGASLRDARSRLARAPEEAITIEGRLIALTHSRLARFEERCRRSTPGVSALGRVVRKAVLAEIETVESGHGRSRRSRFFPAPECNLAGELFDPFFALHRVV